MNIRPRRLRANENLRTLTRETRVSSSALIQPLFVKEGVNIKDEIKSMENNFHYSPDRLAEGIEAGLVAGVSKFLLFGLPLRKDDTGSEAWNDRGVIQQGLRAVRQRFGDSVYLITDVCLCEYTSHGHCGLLSGTYVDNDSTVERLAEVALSHSLAGADMVAPSDMMDGRVKAIRSKLDAHGQIHTPIMSYSVKYASSFYGPFREAAGSAPGFGDRKTYQMDWHNASEALKVAAMDVRDGADLLIVKPALSYLDVIQAVSSEVNVPVAAYNVSGEYAMIKAAAKLGLIDEYGAMCESAVSMFRAGADILITYFAKELASAIRKGDIG
jgi:porphobilinogen synthase